MEIVADYSGMSLVIFSVLPVEWAVPPDHQNDPWPRGWGYIVTPL